MFHYNSFKFPNFASSSFHLSFLNFKFIQLMHLDQLLLILKKIIEFFLRCKCTFSPYIFHFFHFGPYILFLPLLVPKPINA